jgi:ElaB/YqjD/DUF883 family membrane-anchored ribosome-binding protein
MTNDALHDTADGLPEGTEAITDNGGQTATKRAEEMRRVAGEQLRHRASEVRHRAEEVRHRADEARHRAGSMVKDLPAGEVTVKAQATASDLLGKAEQAPDSAYLAGVGGAMVLSTLLLLAKKPSMALFVGIWPATILSLLMVLKQRRPSTEIASMGPTEALAGGALIAE